MCLIIVKPPKKIITRKTLKEAFHNYPDGFGFMTAFGDKLFIYKATNNFRQLYQQFRQIESQHPENSFVFHFRQATAGLIDVENTHPFFVNDNLGFCHNGIISISRPDVKRSDTVSFVENILKKMPTDFLKQQGITWLLDTFCTETFNKLVFMDNFGKVEIFGEKEGEWKEGLWFSNKYEIGIYRFKNFDCNYRGGCATQENRGNYVIPAYEICVECGEYAEVSDGMFGARGFTCDDCSFYSKQQKGIIAGV